MSEPHRSALSDDNTATHLRERLAAIVEASDDVIITKDLEGIIRSWNPGAERMFGYTADEVIGQPISILAVPERVPEIADILSRIRRGERVDHYETQRRTKDGRILDILLSVSPIRDSAGQVIGASKVARDITQQKRATELQERLAAIVESSDDAIISKDLNGIIRSWNGGAQRLFGYSAEEVIGKPVSILAVPDRIEDMPDILARIRRGERVHHYETRRQTKDGRVLDISLTVSPLRDSRGIIIGASKVARDITSQKRDAELRQRVAAIVESSEDAIISIDLDGNILSWNAGAERIFCYTAQEITGSPVSILAVSDRSEEVPELLARIRRGERVHHYETQRRSRDGRVLDISLTVSPIRNAAGAIIGASKIARDITAQKQAEYELRCQQEILRESETRYRLAVRAANSVIWDWHFPTGQVVWSELLHPVFGYSPDTPGNNIATALPWWTSHIHPDERDEVVRSFNKVTSSGENFWKMEYRFERADGSWANVLDQGYLKRDHSGNAVRVVGSMIDVSERKRSERDLENANRELRAANRELEEFAYVASHDLKEPLRMVNSYTQLLLRRLPDATPELREYADYVYTGVRRMEALINDLLSFSRVIHGERETDTVSLDDVLDDVMSVLRDLITSEGATISRDPLPTVTGDRIQLGQVFQNLLSNALKYRGSSAPVIHISASPDDTEWTISVADNGIGVKRQYSEQIFGLFKRLHSRDVPGTGVGLAICRRIVERHGGRIWVESSGEGLGSVFRFSLPSQSAKAVTDHAD